MATLNNNVFSSYSLTEEETIRGSLLTVDQKHILQNELSQIAEQLLALTFDPQNPIDFAQQHSYLSGQMSILRIQLLRSDEAEKSIISSTGL